jgi:hypothetical protein
MRRVVILLAISCSTSSCSRAAAPPQGVGNTAPAIAPVPPTVAEPLCGAEVADQVRCDQPQATCRDRDYHPEVVVYCGIQVAGYQCRDGAWQQLKAYCSPQPGRRRGWPPELGPRGTTTP